MKALTNALKMLLPLKIAFFPEALQASRAKFTIRNYWFQSYSSSGLTLKHVDGPKNK